MVGAPACDGPSTSACEHRVVVATISTDVPEPAEILDLYLQVGWSAYTDEPDRLVAAVRGSTHVLAARDESGTLVGLLRALSDGHTITYVQDILVAPAAQRGGVGGALLDELLRLSATIRQVVLITDDEASQRAFYESRGLVEVHDVEPSPLRAFVRLGT